MTTTPNPEHGSIAPRFASLPEFVDWLAVRRPRQVTDTTAATWCPEWWRHPEVVERLELLWVLFELARIEGPEAAALWWVTTDVTMTALHDPAGSLKFCNPRHGHKDLLAPLPLVAPPVGMFPTTASDPEFRADRLTA
jgi:hypothetical protein